MPSKILVTGAAGFIGYHLTKRLVDLGHEVIGLDNLNNYYDPRLKLDRLSEMGIENALEINVLHQSKLKKGYSFIKLNLEDWENLNQLFLQHKFDKVINLAAQAGVRYSLDNPRAYIDSNIVGFINVLEACRHHAIKHLTYASSSSVYGLNESQPFSTTDNVDHPISLYAATKKSNELMAHSYSHLFNLPTSGLRFFTVYGPWGRPDMAYFIFTKAILYGKEIQVFNNGQMSRDFTYIDDVVEGLVQVNEKPPTGNKNWSGKSPNPEDSIAPFQIHNIGNNSPVNLLEFIETIERALSRKAKKVFLPMQPGDVSSTYADVESLMKSVGYKPKTSLKYGVERFVEWYKKYYKI